MIRRQFLLLSLASIPIIDIFFIKKATAKEIADKKIIEDILALGEVLDNADILTANRKLWFTGKVVAKGTFTKSSADAPEDINRTECDGYFTRLWLIPTEGPCAFHCRMVANFEKKVFYLGNYASRYYFPFPEPTGKVNYIICHDDGNGAII